MMVAVYIYIPKVTPTPLFIYLFISLIYVMGFVLLYYVFDSS